ncbi:hypothetical protein Q3G72_004423 [Acer saccharum]|nr:hypothetical protein Q3G72_004423 [Acer saccharum]
MTGLLLKKGRLFTIVKEQHSSKRATFPMIIDFLKEKHVQFIMWFFNYAKVSVGTALRIRTFPDWDDDFEVSQVFIQNIFEGMGYIVEGEGDIVEDMVEYILEGEEKDKKD